MNMMKNVKLTLVNAAAVSAGTEIDSTHVDMTGFDGVVFFGTMATVNAGNYVKVQQDDAVGDGTMADLTGTKVVPSVNANTYLVDIYRPMKRYVRLVVIRAGANTATGDIYALQYKGTKAPVTQPTTCDAEYHISPAEGTA